MGDMMAMLGGLRLGLALALFLAGLLAICEPPTRLLWKLSIVVLEGGHWMAVPCLLLSWLALRSGASGRIAGQVFLAAALLYGSTVPRAYRTAANLAADFRATWGEVAPAMGAFQRKAPLSFLDLFRGVPVAAGPPAAFPYANKDGLELKLDFYRPGLSKRPAPCVVVVHGGGWDSGERGQLDRLNSFLAQGGYAVADLDYRLAPRYKYPAPVEDVRDALTWLKAHADGLGIDPGRFVLLGRSAGGQIALQAAYVDPDPSVKGVIAFYAPSDMVFGYSLPTNRLILDSRRLMENYLGGTDAQAHAAYLASSPIEHLSPRIPPTLLLHGRSDALVSIQHTEHISGRLGPLGIRHFEVVLPWASHGYDYVFRGPGSQISLYFIERFLAGTTQ